MLQAAIDLGTNTFHLLIVEKQNDVLKPIFKDSTPTYIGRAGINKGLILPDAIERALVVLQRYRQKIDEFGVTNVKAIGTSAIRNASNRADFCAEILTKTGIDITVISGDDEAEYIYRGVRLALDLGQQPSMIIDIGGGSVEFIICNAERIFWKQSFEIGGQRLMERFMKTDPISPSAIARLHDYFQEQLLPLANAVHQYQPKVLVGVNGPFDTLKKLNSFYNKFNFSSDSKILTVNEIQWLIAFLIPLSAYERKMLTGMPEHRFEMIVVVTYLINFVLEQHSMNSIKLCEYSLIEGALV